MWAQKRTKLVTHNSPNLIKLGLFKHDPSQSRLKDQTTIDNTTTTSVRSATRSHAITEVVGEHIRKKKLELQHLLKLFKQKNIESGILVSVGELFIISV